MHKLGGEQGHNYLCLADKRWSAFACHPKVIIWFGQVNAFEKKLAWILNRFFLTSVLRFNICPSFISQGPDSSSETIQLQCSIVSES